jgi:hypothetical protein
MLVVPLLLTLAACSSPRPVCSCIPGLPLTSRANVAATVGRFGAVFEGTVVRTAYLEDSVVLGTDTSHVPQTARWQGLEVTVAVSRRWKGELADTVRVRTPLSMCGVRFVAGRAYLVFGHFLDSTGRRLAAAPMPRDPVYTTKCSPTAAAGGEAMRIAELLGRPLPRAVPGRSGVPEA